MSFLHQDVLLQIIDSTFMAYYATISYQKYFIAGLYPILVQYAVKDSPHGTTPTKAVAWIDFVVDCGFSTALICAYPKSRFISISGWIYLICGFRLNI